MAVTPPRSPRFEPPRLMRDFWPRFEHQAKWIIIIPQIVIAIGLGLLLTMLGIFQLSSPILWLVILVVFALGTASGFYLLGLATQPGKDIFAAIIKVSGEPTDVTPPNPNDDQYATSGFKEALNTVYALAATEPKAAGETSNPLLESAMNETPVGLIIMSHARKIVYSNTAAPTGEDTSGEPTLNVMWNGDDTLDAWLDGCDSSAVRDTHTWRRIADKLPDEEDRRLFDIVANYEQGKDAEVVVTFIDRTASYAAGEEDLNFIAFAAHELRGPITVIRGYLEVLEGELGDVLKDDQHELFRRLTVSANRLSGYVNNILNTSRYDRRHLSVHLTEDSVQAIYDTITDDMQLRASSQGRILTVNFPKDLPTIAADRASLSEVLGNLIDNAIKYSNEGGTVNVTAEVKGDFVEITVQDHGIGMPQGVVENLFQKFYRSHRSRETVAGTGIGLYISKAIVESHGGTINAQSVEGEGSTFLVDIPIYSTVADKLKSSDNSNATLITQGGSWIKNHSMYRG